MDESISVLDHPANLLTLIDVLSEDDSLLYSRLNDFSPHRSTDDQKMVQSSELMEAVNDGEVQETVDYFKKLENQSPQLIQPLESVLSKNRKHEYNLRKSLAWDSAFSTSEGVLDPEELSSMIGGIEKSSLHAIQEDVPNSDDSGPALESDTLSVSSADADFFEDVRASIQKSAKVTNGSNPGGKSRSTGTDTQRVPSSEIKSLATRNKIEDAIASKKMSSVHMVGPRKLFKHGYVPSQLPQSKVLGKLAPSSTSLNNRVGINFVKVENDETEKKTSGEGTTQLKATTPANSKTNGSKPLSVATRKDLQSSIGETSGSIKPGSNLSPSNIRKRNTIPRTSKTQSSGSTGKTSTKSASKTDAQPGKSLPTYHSMSKHSCGTSPVSSISEWSSDMSSCLLDHSSRASLDTSSLVSEASEVFESLDHDDNQHLGGQETGTIRLLNESMRKASLGSDSVPLLSAQPSSLRLPSPKIGFFDGVKSASMNHPVSYSLPKGGNGNTVSSGGIIMTKVRKVQQARTIMAIRSTKPDCPQTSVKANLKSSKPYSRNSNNPNKDSCASRNLRNVQGISQERRHQMPHNQPQMNKKCQLVAECVVEAGASMKDVRAD